MSRPKKPFDKLKILQINIRVTLDEQILLEDTAKAYGMNVVGFIRRRSLNKQLPKYIMSNLERELLIELSRIGNNINQISKKANQKKLNLIELECSLIELEKCLNEIKNKLLNDC